MNFITKHFRQPTAIDLAKSSLAEYQRQLLVCQAAAAYNQKMSEYYQEGIARLSTYSKPA